MNSLFTDEKILSKYMDPEFLIEKYYDEDMTQEEIAKLCHVSFSVISKWMGIYGFPRRHIRAIERNSNGLKLCQLCYMYKSESEFGKRSNGPDGLEIYCRKCLYNKTRATRLNKKVLVLQVYSNFSMKCKLCGENNIDLLCIDHIKGGGCKHLEIIKEECTTFYKWLERNGFPSGYRVLCRNCNYKEYLRLIDEKYNKSE